MPQLLHLTAVDLGTTRLLTLSGELDLASCGEVRAAAQRAFDDRVETLVVDLASVSFLDSAGIHLLVQVTQQAAQEGTRVALLPGPPHVQEVLAVAGVDEHLPFAR